MQGSISVVVGKLLSAGSTGRESDSCDQYQISQIACQSHVLSIPDPSMDFGDRLELGDQTGVETKLFLQNYFSSLGQASFYSSSVFLV